MKHLVLSAAAISLPLLAIGGAAIAQDAAVSAIAELHNANGDAVGMITVNPTPNGVIIIADVTGIPAGTYGFHVHETGACDGPTFETAGGHLNPTDAEHGFDNPNGPHAGDLPNLHIPDGGALTVELFSEHLWLDGDGANLLDADGAAFMIHAMHDDHMTDPAGDAGDRIICGVLAPGGAG